MYHILQFVVCEKNLLKNVQSHPIYGIHTRTEDGCIMMTQTATANPTRFRGYPDQIIEGDEVYLQRAPAHSMQQLALAHLEQVLGGPGPFFVRSIVGPNATIDIGGEEGKVSTLPLSRLTRDRPLRRLAVSY